MPDIFSLAARWWKQILLIVILALVTSSVIVFIKPQLYLSVTTALPGNPLSADKARIFSKNIEALYSDIGLPDDLDIIVGTGQLDTIYLAVTDQFNLYDHYKLGNDEKARQNAATKLKKYSRITKSDYGELKIKVWNIDRNLSPQLANALMEKLQMLLADVQNQHNRQVLDVLHKAAGEIQKKIDSLDSLKQSQPGNTEIKKKNLAEQLLDYDKMINEYELIIEANPQALRITEKARAAMYPDKPRRAEIIIITGILSLLFALLLSLILDRKNQKQ
jgi:uncharacterized protein involved in exopolysaccharide biosynthesis